MNKYAVAGIKEQAASTAEALYELLQCTFTQDALRHCYLDTEPLLNKAGIQAIFGEFLIFLTSTHNNLTK
jgi:hypothetical protein